MNGIKNTLLAFFLALAGHEQPSTPPDETVSAPSALVAEQHLLTAEMLVGAWRGKRVLTEAGTTSVIEAVLVDAARPSSLLGYFTFGDGPSASTVRRLGRLAGDRLTFTLRDGREMILSLDVKHMRLLGREIGTGGQSSTFELSRVRSRVP